MPICASCGNEVPAGAHLCEHCGQRLADDGPGGYPVKDPSTGPLFEVRLVKYLKTGWQTFCQYPWEFLWFSLVLAIVAVIHLLSPGIRIVLPASLSDLLGILLSAAITVLEAGIFIVSAKLLQRRTFRLANFFAGFHYLRPLMIFGFLYCLIPDIPILCFHLFQTLFPHPSHDFWEKFISYLPFMGIISGLALLAFGLVFLFTPLLVIDRRLGLWEAMNLSRRTVQRRWWLFLGFIILGGGVLTVIGVAISWPLTLVFAANSKFQFSGLRMTVPFLSIAVTAAYADIFGLQSKEY